MTNACELLLNIVITNKLKVLISLRQNGTLRAAPLNNGGTRTIPLPVERQGLTHSC